MRFNVKQWKCLSGCRHLTKREVEAAKLVCAGMNNEQISRRLRIAYNTVRAHLGNIYRKAGVQGKTELVLECIEVLRKARI